MDVGPAVTFNLILNLIFTIPLVLTVYGFSKRKTGKPLVPTLLTCIPVFGWFYFYFYCYKTIAYLLDEINRLSFSSKTEAKIDLSQDVE